MREFDLIIRGGTIIDGLGGVPFEGDVAIAGDRIAAVGQVAGGGIEEIDARGCIVTPGFVDIHSHYDGQVTWDDHLSPSSNHGVTTTLMGNCGVGFAPCRPEDRATMIDVMEGIEDIPGIVLAEGIPWNWESFPQYLDALDQRRTDTDFGTQVPHIAVRVHVMGQRAVDCEPANPADIAQMMNIVREGIEAGAMGFSTSRALGHRTASGEVAPTTYADENELLAIAAEMARLGRGSFMAASDFHYQDGRSVEFDLLRKVAETSGRPTFFPVLQHNDEPDKWRRILDDVAVARAAGLDMTGQVVGRPVGILYGLELSSHPFSGCASYRAIAALPLAERLQHLRDPAVRARLLTEEPRFEDLRVQTLARSVGDMFRMGSVPQYSPGPEDSFAAIAAREQRSPLEVAYDVLLEDEGHGVIYHPARNFADGNLDTVLDMMRRPESVLGLADGGAHLGRICDASIPTFMLTYWARDRQGPRLPLTEVVRAMTSVTADAVGFGDRGRLLAGYKADVNVIDYDGLSLDAPRAVFDLPAGGRRLFQSARGYRATILSGVATIRDDRATGALPGRLVRHERVGPAA